jgi:hypothetical protein
MNLTAALRVWTWVKSGALLLRHVARRWKNETEE